MRLTELFELDDGLPRGAEGMLESEALSPEEEARILARTLEKAGLAPREKGEERPMKKTRFGLMLLAAALCVGTVAASAAAYFRMNGTIAGTLGLDSEEERQLLAPGGSDIRVSQDCGGWTLTVDQAVGDRNCAYILLDLAAPEGTVLDADLYQLDCLLAFEGSRGGSYGCRQVEDEDKTDNRIAFLIRTTMEGDLRDAAGALEVRELRAVTLGEEDTAEDDKVEPIPGLAWRMSFPMDYEDNPVTYRPGRTVTVTRGEVQGEIKVEKVEITPLSLAVTLSGKRELLNRVEALTEGEPTEGAVLVAAEDGDGAVYQVESSAGNSRLGSFVQVITFRPAIDPAGVASVVVDGTEIPLTK